MNAGRWLSLAVLVVSVMIASAAGSAQDQSGVPSIAPDLSFSANPTIGVAPLTVQFAAKGLGGPFWWHFGDGQTSHEQNASHVYTNPGSYTVIAEGPTSILWVGHVEVLAPSELYSGMYFVTDYGAVGDGNTDDSDAFQKAIDAAALTGGTVFVPPVLGDKGYVLKKAVVVKEGVSLVGSLAGFSTNAWRASQEPEQVKGAKILARPSELRKPLFELQGGVTVRGLWILYDKQPWPTDEEFQTKFGYATFAKARDPKDGFFAKYVKPFGPTFYVTMGESTCIEDIRADRYYDFFYLKAGARASVNRIILYGYKRAFVIEQGYDVNRLSNILIVPLSPIGKVCFEDEVVDGKPTGKCRDERLYSWICGVIVSQEDNIGVQIGCSDGYTLSNLYFYAVHTGFRLGASKEMPIHDPVADTNFYPEEGKPGPAPWGSMSNIGIDGCNIGLDFVRPAGIATHISNLLVYPFIDDGKDFPAEIGTGSRDGVSRQAAFLFEATYARRNTYGELPTILVSNLEVASSWTVSERFADVARSMPDANGRVFLVAGDARVEVFGFVLSLYPGSPSDRLISDAYGAGDVSVRVRGCVLNGIPESDWTWTRK